VIKHSRTPNRSKHRAAQPDNEDFQVHRHPPRLVAGQPVGRRTALRLILKVEIAERLPARVFDDQRLGVQ
jgi:hypothetical protein